MDTRHRIMSFDFVTEKRKETHFHQNPEIIYVLEGTARVELDSDSYKLHKGDFILINANKRHSYQEAGGELLLAVFYINFSLIAEYMGTNQLLFWCNTVTDRSEAYDQLRHALDRILNRFYDREKEGEIYLNSIYYEVVYLLMSNFMIRGDDARIKEQFSPENSRIFEIQNYVQANYTKPLSLNDLTRKLYLSNAYLSKYIKKHFGLSFLEYVNNVRLFHAVDELIYSDKKITRIAMDNGFPTAAAFNKAFKEIYHLTPSAYRQKMHNSENNDEKKQGKEKQEVDLRVRKYLEGKPMPVDEMITRNMNLCVVDTEKVTILKHPWSKIINMCDVDELINYDIQQQILLMKKEIGFEYVRIYNLFKQDMYEEMEDGTENYNFSRIDRGLDFLIENHLKPFVELAFKPISVNYTINLSARDMYNEIIFKNSESYQRIIEKFAAHIANRYGMEEIEKWYFELWKDDRWNMLEEDGPYFSYFECSYNALKNISPKIKVGGAGFALGYDNFHYGQLLGNWKKRNIQPDFISVYAYSYLLQQQNGVYFGRRSIDNSFIKNQLELFKKELEKLDFSIPELIISEWNLTISNRNRINDSCGLAAYIVKNCIECESEADMMGYWHGSDLHTESYDADRVLYGDNGLLTKDGIKKPSFYSMQFLGQLKPELLGKTGNAILTTDHKGVYTIVCHNCKKLNYRYTMVDEKDIKYENISEFYEDTDAIHLKFQINHVQNGDYSMRILYVNDESGSIQDVWKDMGYFDSLSREELTYIRKSATPGIKMQRVHVDDHILRIETTLKAHEIRMLDIHYQYV